VLLGGLRAAAEVETGREVRLEVRAASGRRQPRRDRPLAPSSRTPPAAVRYAAAVRTFTGTSGFSYDPWRGPFYPEDLPADEMLSFYAGKLDAVEINNTFYRMPRRDVVARWRTQVPEQFRFAVKASRRITHQMKLAGTAELLGYLHESLQALEDTLGCVLFQLPKYVRKDLDLLARFLDQLPSGLPPVFEFKHASWTEPDVLDVLRARGAALCANDEECDGLPPLPVTSTRGYLRLRQEDYDDATLRMLVADVRATGWDEVFVFFKHEDAGAGPRLAARCKELFAETG
jgi:uncharacterized protein YecE (DUF72 family)